MKVPKMTLRAMQSIDIIVHQLMSMKAAFVRKLFIAFVTMKHFSSVQNLVKLHPMNSCRSESATRRRTVQKRTTGSGIGGSIAIRASLD